MDFYINVPPPVHFLNVTEAFKSLSNVEKDYVFSCTQASWIGGLIGLIQTSPESAGIFLFVSRFFHLENVHSFVEKATKNNFSDEEITHILSYFASVLGNFGNYLSFGDTKFIPAINVDRVTEFLSLSSEFSNSETGLKALWKEIAPAIYSLSPRRLRLGFSPTEITSYYSEDCIRSDAELVQKYLENVKIEAYNTRLFKSSNSNSKVYSIRFASAEKKIQPVHFDALPSGTSLQLEYGDYCELMELLVDCSLDAKAHSLNKIESEMWDHYAQSFYTGSLDSHKDASRLWVKDKCPVVENYIGFIETYRDPLGVRAEFESFVAVVNRSMSSKFQRLVDNAVELLSNLPWPSTYEKDRFLQPDFTSLDVVTFATSGIPVGINIPNYDDVRQVDGFKNVSLGNVLSARFKDPKSEFLREEDKKLYVDHAESSFELQVGLHELLGHGSGKLFQRSGDGILNFDTNSTKDIISGGPIRSWYGPGETYDSKFSSLSSAIEECRAECIGIYLCNLPLVLEQFNLNTNCSTDSVPDVVYVNWLSMVRSGVTSMEFYSPAENAGDIGSWRQAHCCARYVILRVLIEADNSLVRVDEIVGDDGEPDLTIFLDRQKLLTVGRPAIGEFLRKIQYYKSTANAKDGCAFFQHYCQLLPEHIKLRQIVINRKKPRPIFVQPGLRKTPHGVELISYPTTYAGVIQSFVDRYGDLPLGQKALDALETIWRRELPYFKNIPL
uniref:Dipeptidyl peptidase 3 n=2 Tax=Schistosoma haematobium TaxID=6185 RepID=A0A095CCX8_SCHHA